MTTSLTVLSWNVQGETGIRDERLQRQLEFLETQTTDVDVFLLQAVNYEGNPTDGWEGQLGALLDHFSARDYDVVHTADWAKELAESDVQPHAGITGAHNRCNLTASRWSLDRRPLTLRNRGDGKPVELDYYYAHFPEKLLVSALEPKDDESTAGDDIEVWNVGIINGANWGEEKVNMLETVYGRVYLQTTKTATPVLLGGDFNAPKRETESQEIVPHGTTASQYTRYPFYGDPHYIRAGADDPVERQFKHRRQRAEARIFDPDVSDWGMKDAYWAASESPRAASTDDYTHVVSNGSPAKKRLDHVLVSDAFTVQRCDLWNGRSDTIDAFESSDHAPVVAKLDVDPAAE